MSPLGPLQARIRAQEEARDAFLRAAAALTEVGTSDVIAFALLEAAVGMMKLAEADGPDCEALHRVEVRLRATPIGDASTLDVRGPSRPEAHECAHGNVTTECKLCESKCRAYNSCRCEP